MRRRYQQAHKLCQARKSRRAGRRLFGEGAEPNNDCSQRARGSVWWPLIELRYIQPVFFFFFFFFFADEYVTTLVTRNTLHRYIRTIQYSPAPQKSSCHGSAYARVFARRSVFHQAPVAPPPFAEMRGRQAGVAARGTPEAGRQTQRHAAFFFFFFFFFRLPPSGGAGMLYAAALPRELRFSYATRACPPSRTRPGPMR